MRHPAEHSETITERCIICGARHTYTCDPLAAHDEQNHLTCSEGCATQYASIQYEDYRQNEAAERAYRARGDDFMDEADKDGGMGSGRWLGGEL